MHFAHACTKLLLSWRFDDLNSNIKKILDTRLNCFSWTFFFRHFIWNFSWARYSKHMQ